MDFEADPNHKFKPLFFSISKPIKFPFTTQLKYCQKLNFEADPNNKFEPLTKNTIFRFQNQLNFPLKRNSKNCQKLDVEASPEY